MIKYLNQTSLDRNYLSLRPYTATPISADFSKLLVNKPWGSEYMIFSNPSTEIWNLFIGYQRATSMHCHPNKKTSLLVIEGRVLFSSLNESLELTTHDAVAIDPGTFHSTQGISVGGARVLEFESPPMKHDLVRLEDRYGRTQEGYEGLEKMISDVNHARLPMTDYATPRTICSNRMCIRQIQSKADVKNAIRDSNGRIAVVIGGVIRSKMGELLYTATNPISLGELSISEHIYEDTLIMFVGHAGL